MGLGFDLGIFKECQTILQNFQGWKLVFTGISKDKVTNLKLPGGGRGSEKYILNFRLDFFWNSAIPKHGNIARTSHHNRNLTYNSS